MKRSILTAWLAVFALSLASAASAGADEQPSEDLAAPFVPGEVLVQFEGEKVERRVELPEGVPVNEAVRSLRADPDVSLAAPNYIARASYILNDPGRGSEPRGWVDDQWNFLDGPGGINATAAWDILRDAGRPGGRRPNGNLGPKVAVVDTGVAYRAEGRRFIRSPDLARSSFTRGKDFVDGDELALDENGHGTHIASTIVERVNNGRAVTGLAYGVRVMPVRVLNADGNGTARNVARGIRWAASHGAKVINLSLEFGIGTVDSCADIPTVCNAIRKALKKNILVVAAAGNQGRDQVAYPAYADNPDDPDGVSAAGPVVAVGAGTIRGCLSDFSNHGPGLDLVAPGGGDDRGAAGAQCDPFGPSPGIVQLTLRDGSVANGNFKQFGFPRYDGTSMAAAHVSATAALVLSSQTLKKSIGRPPKPKNLLNWIQARTRTTVGEVPLETKFYGAGLLDAAAALTE
jgi:serine protease